MIRHLATATVGATLALCAPAGAAQISAAAGGDGTADDGKCSLREAIHAANNGDTAGGECTSGTIGADQIILQPLAYDISAGAAGEDNNASGDFDIKQDLTITGQGPALTTINGHRRDRVLDIVAGFVTITGVTITGGAAPGGAASMAGSSGGGIRALSPLTLDDVVVTLNAAGRGGNGATGTSGDGGSGGDGGGVHSVSSLTVTDSEISDNLAGAGGNGGGPAVTCGSQTTGGRGGWGGSGGGIDAVTGATVARTTISGNMAGAGGSGGCANTPGWGGSGGSGGGIRGPLLSLSDSTVTNNVAGDGAAAGQDADGPQSALTGRGGGGGGIAAFTEESDANTAVSILRSTITLNRAGSGGAGALGNTLGATRAPGGHGGGGGGAMLGGWRSATISDSTIANNQAGAAGPTTNTLAVGRGGSGGGVAFRVYETREITLTRTTIADNAGGPGGASWSGGSGGGLELATLDEFPPTAALTNVTISGNRPGAGGEGGGIDADLPSIMTLTHVTVASNQSSGIALDAGGGQQTTATVRASILASNTPVNCELGATESHDGAVVTDGGNNVVFGTQCNGLAATTADPLLQALADNGGGTQTMALGEGSSALDIVPSSGCTATDQRGTVRPQGTGCDAGAFELSRPVDAGSAGGAMTTNTTEATDTTQPPAATSPTQVATGAAADTTAPRITLLLARQRLGRVLRRGFACAFSTDETGSAVARLFRGGRRIGSARIVIGTPGKQRLVVKLTRRARLAAARARTLRVRLVLTIKDSAGNATAKTKTSTLRR